MWLNNVIPFPLLSLMWVSGNFRNDICPEWVPCSRQLHFLDSVLLCVHFVHWERVGSSLCWVDVILSILKAILQVDLECLHSGFYGANGDGGGGNNWSYKTCKVAVRMSPPRNQNAVFTGRMPFLWPNQQCPSTEGKAELMFRYHKYNFCYSLQ